jgi:2-polyprenyl-3-methyl-5-hydroxy-6-metoxy-1,4-benzoquinol methylase
MSTERQAMVRSWTTNADAWTAVVRDGLIPSRRAGTDAAILAAVRACGPRTVLDVGCGEGWLLRALAADGITVTGTDVSPELVRAAAAAGTPDVHAASYGDLLHAPALARGPFDVVVCNFALLDDDVQTPLAAMRARTAEHGALLVQTVHPWAAHGDGAYRSGWRTETFDSFGRSFAESMPWYYRTMSSWLAEITRANLRLVHIDEPLHPETGRPLSLLLHCTIA